MNKKGNTSLHSQEERAAAAEREGRAEHIHHNVRREEEGEGKYVLRFGGPEPVIFKPVIGGSNVVGLAPNLVGSFPT
jgi:hypothetical protein